jgi:hypothetical protein
MSTENLFSNKPVVELHESQRDTCQLVLERCKQKLIFLKEEIIKVSLFFPKESATTMKICICSPTTSHMLIVI